LLRYARNDGKIKNALALDLGVLALAVALAELFGAAQLVAFLAFEGLFGFARFLLDLFALIGIEGARRSVIAFAFIGLGALRALLFAWGRCFTGHLAVSFPEFLLACDGVAEEAAADRAADSSRGLSRSFAELVARVSTSSSPDHGAASGERQQQSSRREKLYREHMGRLFHCCYLDTTIAATAGFRGN
jgi:hypothetical protein